MWGGSDVYSSEENVMWLSELEFKFASRPSYLVVKHYSLFHFSTRECECGFEGKTKNAFVKSGNVYDEQKQIDEKFLPLSKSPFNLVYIYRLYTRGIKSKWNWIQHFFPSNIYYITNSRRRNPSYWCNPFIN